MKFNYDVFDPKIDDYKDYEFEVQNMDAHSFDDILVRFAKDVNSRERDDKILKSMVVKPLEARKLSFWSGDHEGLSELINKLCELQLDFPKRSKKRKGFREIEKS